MYNFLAYNVLIFCTILILATIFQNLYMEDLKYRKHHRDIQASLESYSRNLLSEAGCIPFDAACVVTNLAKQHLKELNRKYKFPAYNYYIMSIGTKIVTLNDI